MSLHLIKLSVGPDSLSDLEAWQAQRLKDQKRARQKSELMHITRHMPKRAAELLDDGSIYWVIKGWICARQKLIELRPIIYDGTPHCGIICEPEMIRVSLRPQRAFQGWRYFEGDNAPPDLVKGSIAEDMPEAMKRELASLGLL